MMIGTDNGYRPIQRIKVYRNMGNKIEGYDRCTRAMP